MAEKTTFITLDRNILRWRWYKNSNVFRVFLHLLLGATVKDHDFETITLKRGQLLTTHNTLARQLLLTENQVRGALKKLKTTGEITGPKWSKYQLITVVNYDYYQSRTPGYTTEESQTINRQTTEESQIKHRRLTDGSQHNNNYNNYNKYNKYNKNNAYAQERTHEGSFDADEFFRIAVEDSKNKYIND